jgi:hypothetical protein
MGGSAGARARALASTWPAPPRASPAAMVICGISADGLGGPPADPGTRRGAGRARGGYLRKFPRWAIGRRFASVTGDGGCTLWSSAVRKLKGEPTNENKTAPQTSAAFLRV